VGNKDVVHGYPRLPRNTAREEDSLSGKLDFLMKAKKKFSDKKQFTDGNKSDNKVAADAIW
jgi:hypothetical protein